MKEKKQQPRKTKRKIRIPKLKRKQKSQRLKLKRKKRLSFAHICTRNVIRQQRA